MSRRPDEIPPGQPITKVVLAGIYDSHRGDKYGAAKITFAFDPSEAAEVAKITVLFKQKVLTLTIQEDTTHDPRKTRQIG
jgi:hypothetical protein